MDNKITTERISKHITNSLSNLKYEVNETTQSELAIQLIINLAKDQVETMIQERDIEVRNTAVPLNYRVEVHQSDFEILSVMVIGLSAIYPPSSNFEFYNYRGLKLFDAKFNPTSGNLELKPVRPSEYISVEFSV